MVNMDLQWDIEEYELPGTQLKYYSVSDFKITSHPGLETKKIYGNSYILELPGYQYFHYFQDKVGQYEMLRDYIPDLKLVLVGDFEHAYPPNSNIIGSLVIEESLSVYNIPREDILFLDKTDVWFEKTFYSIRIFNRFLPNSLPGNRLLGPGDGQDYYTYNIETAKKVRELYLTALKLKDSKIFVSRRKMNDMIRTMQSLIDKDLDGTATEEEKERLIHTIRIFGTEADAKMVISQRWISEEDEDKMENFFESLGYRIIDPFNMTFFEQVRTFNSATHVVSVRGSGLYNTIFCNENAKVFIIDTSSKYNFEYKTIVNVGTEHVYEIPVRQALIDQTPQRFFAIDNILRVFENHYMDKL